MRLRAKVVLCVIALTAGLAACTSSKAPAAPTAPAPTSTASTDGSTLKVSAPSPVSPIEDATLSQLNQSVVLTASAVASNFSTSTAAVQYDFELYDPNNTKISTSVVSAPSYTVPIGLNPRTRYTWRVRGAIPSNNAYGPWSSFASFQTPDNSGYIRGNEMYDPLIDGKTVGQINGPITFIPGVGAKLESTASFISYVLPQTLNEGEISMIVTGISQSTPGTSKAKVMGMAQGFDDIVTNERRFTFEKRADGTIAWRFITHDDQVDTGPEQRKIYHFRDEFSYFWQFTFRNNTVRALVQEGPAGSNGMATTVYNESEHFNGRAYDPNPHVIFVGNPVGRSGADSASIPGMIVRQVWVSGNPRPASINK